MKKVTIGVFDESDFFQRGRRFAKAADAGEHISEEAVVTFGDPAELLRALNAKQARAGRSGQGAPGLHSGNRRPAPS